MGFSSLIRSCSRVATKSQYKRRQRAHSSPPDYAARFAEAEDAFHAEDAHIMREEIRRRNQNDSECKRQMSMIERNKKTQLKELEDAMTYQTNVIDAHYQAGKIDHREMQKQKDKLKQSVDARCASCIKKYREEQAKAQRIFSSRGSEIAEDTATALRMARERLQYGQRIGR